MIKKSRIILSSLLYFLGLFISIIYFYQRNRCLYRCLYLDITRMIFIITFIVISYDLFLILKKPTFIQVFEIIIGLTCILWFTYHMINFMKIDFEYSRPLLVFTDLLFNICFTMMGPALTLLLMSEIKNKTSKYMEVKVLGRFHLHEGLFGMLSIAFVIPLGIFYVFLDVYIIKKSSAKWILTVLKTIIINLTFFGSFFIFRDRKDIINFKFLEVKNPVNSRGKLENSSKFMQNMDHNSVDFFTHSRFKLYPIGILFNSFSINAIIHERNFLVREIFNLRESFIIFFGFLLLFTGSGLIGIDWLRMFKKLYPNLGIEITQFVKHIRNQK
jgi:hypothetical protein